MAWGQSLPAPIAINPSLPTHTQRQAETYSLEVRFNVIKFTPPPQNVHGHLTLSDGQHQRLWCVARPSQHNSVNFIREAVSDHIPGTLKPRLVGC